MRVVVTGARGRVGRATVDALVTAGHNVTATDLGRPVFERGADNEAHYVQADLTDAGEAFALIRGAEAVVHCAAIPVPTANPPQVVFQTNIMSTFNCIEAAVRWGVPRFVNVSSESAAGFFFPERPFLPFYVPIDEEHPLLPQDPYALSKVFGEQLMDAALRRSDINVITIRPSSVIWEGNAEVSLGPLLRDPAANRTPNVHSYIDAYDLADAIVAATESDLPGHEIMYIASPDNIGNHDFGDLLRNVYGWDIPLRALARPDSSGISCAKAGRLLGYDPKRSWSDYVDRQGRLLPAAAGRLAAIMSSRPG
jgi:UDP-glucose 4-epimerase